MTYFRIDWREVSEDDEIIATLEYEGRRAVIDGRVWKDPNFNLRVGNVLVSYLIEVDRKHPPRPESPFEKGDKVRIKGSTSITEFIVEDWSGVGCRGRWEIQASSGSRHRISYDPGLLELIFEPELELPLRVGDWVRYADGNEFQIVMIRGTRAFSSTPGLNGGLRFLTRIEPPVGWPVGVPDPDAPGGVEWYRCTGGDEYYVGSCSGVLSWSELVAAGGVPALAVSAA